MDKHKEQPEDETIALLKLAPLPVDVEPSEEFRASLRHKLMRARLRLLPPLEEDPQLAA
jgi:hypothetical protein